MPQKKQAPNRAKELLDALVEAVTKTGPSSRGVAVNNALMLSFPPEIDPGRLRSLREYVLALAEVPLEHADGVLKDPDNPEAGYSAPPCLSYEELVTVLLSAALLVQTDRILGRKIQ